VCDKVKAYISKKEPDDWNNNLITCRSFDFLLVLDLETRTQNNYNFLRCSNSV
jgi:hypothetical protein